MLFAVGGAFRLVIAAWIRSIILQYVSVCTLVGSGCPHKSPVAKASVSFSRFHVPHAHYAWTEILQDTEALKNTACTATFTAPLFEVDFRNSSVNSGNWNQCSRLNKSVVQILLLCTLRWSCTVQTCWFELGVNCAGIFWKRGDEWWLSATSSILTNCCCCLRVPVCPTPGGRV